MKLAWIALAAFTCVGCKASPPWAELPKERHAGDATITGAPLAVPHLPPPYILDGKLDDAMWAQAALVGPLGDCYDGHAVASSPVAAFARVAWDERGLSVGMVVRDGHAGSPFARGDVDPHVWGASSGIELMLQPGDPGDNRDYYELQIDAHEAVFDSHFDDYNQPVTGTTKETRVFGHQDWSSDVQRAVDVEGRFWSVEFSLPWVKIQKARVAVPPKPGDVWRANFYSFRDGQRQALCWSPLRGEGNFHKTSRFGRLQFQP